MSSPDPQDIETENSDYQDPKDNELFIGLVSPVGTDKQKVIDAVIQALSNVDYNYEIIKLSDLLHFISGLPQNLDSSLPVDDRIKNHMDAGDQLRRTARDGSALAKLAFAEIQQRRSDKDSDKTPIPRMAYIFDSLKHNKELEILKRVYGKNFWLISAYSPINVRIDRLAEDIRIDRHGQSIDDYKDLARKLISRDKEDSGNKYGQKVVKTFHFGDLFVDTNDSSLEKAVERFVNLIFNDIDPTPNTDEYGMFYAKASAFRSASLARQVGATIIDKNGDVLATGTNEVPRYGGGLCGPDNDPEQRESNRGYDSNTLRIIDLLHDFISRLQGANWFSAEHSGKNPDVLVKEIMDNSNLKDARLMDVTEFGREVHAEMAALMNASRQTIHVNGGTLFCTTFPCHVCTKHIIASGITRVVYIEPYPKSLSENLFGDPEGIITVDKKPEPEKIPFQPFVGISPSRFMDLFAWKEKKNSDGSKKEWKPSESSPRYWEDPLQILKNEGIFADNISERLSTTDLSPN